MANDKAVAAAAEPTVCDQCTFLAQPSTHDGAGGGEHLREAGASFGTLVPATSINEDQGGTREESRRNQGGIKEESGRNQGGIKEESGRNQGGIKEESRRNQGGTREEPGRNQGLLWDPCNQHECIQHRTMAWHEQITPR
jgi:hypothetical protein